MLIVQCIYFSELLFHTYDCFFMKAQEVFKFILFLPNFTFKNEKKKRVKELLKVNRIDSPDYHKYKTF